MKQHFVIPASKYFSTNPAMLAKTQPGETVEVLLDIHQETALFRWKSAAGKSCAYPEWMPDNYNLALSQVLSCFGKPVT